MKISKKLFSTVLCAWLFSFSLMDASCEIQTRWHGKRDTISHTLRTRYISPDYFQKFPFDSEFFCQNILPQDYISHRYNPSKCINGGELKNLIDGLVGEIERGKREYKNFDILCKKDFNWKSKSGVLIVKGKNCPFVVKVFIETPETFLKYRSKGPIPTFLFCMNGGMNKHLIGFSRIKNRERLQKFIDGSPFWSEKIALPRKWFVLAKQSRWIEISGKDQIGKDRTVSIPGTYCIVSDFIYSQGPMSLKSSEERSFCMDLCNKLGHTIDANPNNFLKEKDTGKIVIVDTEDFLRTVGMKKNKVFSGYNRWLFDLASSCLKSVVSPKNREKCTSD